MRLRRLRSGELGLLKFWRQIPGALPKANNHVIARKVNVPNGIYECLTRLGVLVLMRLFSMACDLAWFTFPENWSSSRSRFPVKQSSAAKDHVRQDRKHSHNNFWGCNPFLQFRICDFPPDVGHVLGSPSQLPHQPVNPSRARLTSLVTDPIC